MAINTDIFLGSGASITFIPENDLWIGVGLKSGGSALDGSAQSDIQVNTTFDTDFELVVDLYKGCLLERYDTNDALKTTHRITSNTANTFSITPSASAAATDYFVVKSYGAPVPAPVSTGGKRLLSDQWLGILESATFPTTEIETKQVNLSLGGTRNKTYQYKGITSYSGGNLGFVANHGAWLYYFLGKCTQVVCSTDALETALSTVAHRQTMTDSGDDDAFLIRSMNDTTGEVLAGDNATVLGIVETGPIFRRTIGSKICPPISPFEASDAELDFYHKLDRPTGSTTLTKTIEYTFTEQNGDLLPSFALENSFSKLIGGSTQYRTHIDTAETDESHNFVKIARGNRVNTLSMTANANEEVKMTLDLMTRNVHNLAADEVYDARRGVDNETNFINYESSTNPDETREPFFFSDGTFKVLGTTFLKIDSLTLTMNNNLQDKRFLGVGSKDIQEAIPAERTYEIQFTGHVSDNQLYKALINNNEENGQTIELIFEKSNGEKITLNFTDYFITANDFPMSDDKGPIAVSATVMPRNMSLCKVKTHWILQG